MSRSDLQAAIERLEEAMPYRAGIYVQRLADGDALAIRADDVFPQACIIKVPIVLALLQRVVDGDLDWDAPLVVTADRRYGYGQILDRMELGAVTSVLEVIHMALSVSDVGAGLWCQELAGGGAAVNEWLSDRGYAETRVNSRTPGREDDFDRFGWGQSTPRDMSSIFALIRQRRAVRPDADALLDRMLGSTIFHWLIPQALPTDTNFMFKSGLVDHVRSETILVTTPEGPFVCSVFAGHVPDLTPGGDNIAHVFAREVLALAWAEWGANPAHSPGRPLPWPPATGSTAALSVRRRA